MTRMDEEEELRRLFDGLRRVDEASAPGFRQLLGRTRSEQAGARRIPALRFALVAACLSAAMVAVVVLRWPAPEHTRDASRKSPRAFSLEAWKSPTDFLLETPGSELLHATPVLQEPLPPYAPMESPSKKKGANS